MDCKKNSLAACRLNTVFFYATFCVIFYCRLIIAASRSGNNFNFNNPKIRRIFANQADTSAACAAWAEVSSAASPFHPQELFAMTLPLPPAPAGSIRYAELESLRGIAALLVVLFHIPAWNSTLHELAIIRNGALMVQLFFLCCPAL